MQLDTSCPPQVRALGKMGDVERGIACKSAKMCDARGQTKRTIEVWFQAHVSTRSKQFPGIFTPSLIHRHDGLLCRSILHFLYSNGISFTFHLSTVRHFIFVPVSCIVAAALWLLICPKYFTLWSSSSLSFTFVTSVFWMTAKQMLLHKCFCIIFHALFYHAVFNAPISNCRIKWAEDCYIGTQWAQSGFLWSWISPHMTALTQYIEFLVFLSTHSQSTDRNLGAHSRSGKVWNR